jgi:hypothetical protein
VGAFPISCGKIAVPVLQFLQKNTKIMTASRRKASSPKPEDQPAKDQLAPQEPPAPTGKIFLGEEDKRLLKRFNKHIVNKLGLGGNRSFKI